MKFRYDNYNNDKFPGIHSFEPFRPLLQYEIEVPQREGNIDIWYPELPKKCNFRRRIISICGASTTSMLLKYEEFGHIILNDDRAATMSIVLHSAYLPNHIRDLAYTSDVFSGAISHRSITASNLIQSIFDSEILKYPESDPYKFYKYFPGYEHLWYNQEAKSLLDNLKDIENH